RSRHRSGRFRGWRRRGSATARGPRRVRPNGPRDIAPADRQAPRPRPSKSWGHIQRGFESRWCMRAKRQLLEHTAPQTDPACSITADHVAQRLNMQMLLLTRVDPGKHDVLTLDSEFAMVQPVPPFWMTVTKAEHVEIVERRECRFHAFQITA